MPHRYNKIKVFLRILIQTTLKLSKVFLITITNIIVPSLITVTIGTTPAGIMASAGISAVIMLDDYLRSREGDNAGKGIIGSVKSLFSSEDSENVAKAKTLPVMQKQPARAI